MNMKKTLAGIASYALVGAVAAGIGGSLAYNKSETITAANTFAVGDVKIAQIEMERIEQDDQKNTADNLKAYENNKSLYPACGTIAWAGDDEGERIYQQWPAGGSSALFDADLLGNVQDKMVFVENTGSNPAYVRTVFAFEAGGMTADEMNNKLIHWNRNSTHWQWTDFSEDMSATIKGEKYYLRVATYLGNAGNDHSEHKDGILSPGETTRPSLLQVFLDENADNELCNSFNGSYDILVVSQAVQTEMNGLTGGDALDEAFGEISATNHPWMKTTFVDSAEELTAAIANGGEVVLTDDVVVPATMKIESGTSATLNLNGFDLSYAVDNNGKASAIINNAGTLEIEGEGTISFIAADPDMQEIPSYATNTISNTGTLTIGEGVTVVNESDGGASYAVDNHGTFTLNGGTLVGKRCALRIAKFNTPEVNFTMNGGTVTGATPAWIHLPGSKATDAPKITVVINDGVMQTTKETSADNDVMYTYSFGNSHANTSVTINGGQFLGGTVSIGSGYKGDAPVLTINGGTFEYDVLQWTDDTSTVIYTANK